MSETSYAALFGPVIFGILVGAWGSGKMAGRVDLLHQVRVGLATTFLVSLARVILHLGLDHVPTPVQQGLLFIGGIGAQLAFPVLTLRMLDLFPAARGTAASAQSFVALLITAFTLGVVCTRVLSRLDWMAWTSLIYASLASACWFLARRWHERMPQAQAEVPQ